MIGLTDVESTRLIRICRKYMSVSFVRYKYGNDIDKVKLKVGLFLFYLVVVDALRSFWTLNWGLDC